MLNEAVEGVLLFYLFVCPSCVIHIVIIMYYQMFAIFGLSFYSFQDLQACRMLLTMIECHEVVQVSFLCIKILYPYIHNISAHQRPAIV